MSIANLVCVGVRCATADLALSTDRQRLNAHPPASMSVVHAFRSSDGFAPVSALAADAAGNLYGTTAYGGSFGDGTVFKLTPPAAGQTDWKRTVIHEFNSAAGDGATPAGTLIVDRAGDLFGTTVYGGTLAGGTAFELSPPPQNRAAWTEQLLHEFTNAARTPQAGLTAGASGILYGATAFGGASTRCGNAGCGTVYSLAPPAPGQTAWTFGILYTFGASPTDGALPLGAPMVDRTGALYGTTFGGGTDQTNCTGAPSGCGTVYKLTPPAPGQTGWTQSQLLSFDFNNGAYPQGPLSAAAGALFGTTSHGGGTCVACGVAFELAPPPRGQTAWTQSVLHVFSGTGGDGLAPLGGVVADSEGNLYGTTSQGGLATCTVPSKGSCGTVFELTPPAGGQTTWSEDILYAFADAGSGSGVQPHAGVVR
jgi:uncharacterized repeat protein (TIGR03803 family)